MNWKKLAEYGFFLIVPGGIGLYFLYKYIFGSSGMDANGNYTFASTSTRELRANNPLGVSQSGSFSWVNIDLTRSIAGADGVLTPGIDNELGDHLVIFQSTQDGLNAAAWLLYDAYFGGGTPTIGQIGDKWSGSSPTPPNIYSDYSNSLASILSKPVGAALSYGTDGPALMAGLARMENGSIFVAGIPSPMYQSAIAYGQSA
ncbi:MAG: hypothetical protein ACREL1_00395 [bacterium]